MRCDIDVDKISNLIDMIDAHGHPRAQPPAMLIFHVSVVMKSSSGAPNLSEAAQIPSSPIVRC